jgi:hypothetical protein
VIYAQGTLRYAKLVGDAIADASAYEEHQADGMAFFNVIYPWVKASSVSTADIEAIVNFFDVEAAPDSFNDFAYCKTKKAMETFLGADASLMGTLDAAEEDGTTCAATLPSGASGVATDVGTYYPAGGEDIGGSLSFSVAVMKTLDLLDEPSSFADVLDSFRKTGLAGSADTSRVGEPVWDMFKNYFGSRDLDDGLRRDRRGQRGDPHDQLGGSRGDDREDDSRRRRHAGDSLRSVPRFPGRDRRARPVLEPRRGEVHRHRG